MYRMLLAAIDRDDEAGTDLIARRCASMSRLCDAKVSLIHVLLDVPKSYNRHLPANWQADQVQDARAWLKEVAREYGFEGRLARVYAPAGSIAREVTRTADEAGADVIVVAAHRMNLSRIILGSNAHAITRDASCDVLVVRGE